MLKRIALGAMFIAAGINHFRRPQMYASIMPDYLPWHSQLVALSGVAEVSLGVLSFIPRCSAMTRWGLTALLIAVFPANMHMAVHHERYPRIAAWLLWLRLPLQGVLIWWVWWVTRREEKLTNRKGQTVRPAL